MSTAADHRADLVAARATGLGIGLIVFMVTWTTGARITERILDAPTHAYAAMAIALSTGAVATVRAARRLAWVVNGPQHSIPTRSVTE